jgi:hypothetical protein
MYSPFSKAPTQYFTVNVTWSHGQADGPDVVGELDVAVGDGDADVEVSLPVQVLGVSQDLCHLSLCSVSRRLRQVGLSQSHRVAADWIKKQCFLRSEEMTGFLHFYSAVTFITKVAGDKVISETNLKL